MQVRRGFTLIELMIVLAVIAFLALLALPSYRQFVAKSKRAEAYVNLSALGTAEHLYFAEHGEYTNEIAKLDWHPDGTTYYSYGFAGSEGANFRKGKLNGIQMPPQAKVDQNGFVIAAIGDIDGDGELDILTIDQNRNVVVLQDDLK